MTRHANRKQAARDLAAAKGISYTAALREMVAAPDLFSEAVDAAREGRYLLGFDPVDERPIHWTPERDGHLFISGPKGCGKSYLAAQISRLVSEVGRPCTHGVAHPRGGGAVIADTELGCTTSVLHTAINDAERAMLQDASGAMIFVIDELDDMAESGFTFRMFDRLRQVLFEGPSKGVFAVIVRGTDLPETDSRKDLGNPHMRRVVLGHDPVEDLPLTERSGFTVPSSVMEERLRFEIPERSDFVASLGELPKWKRVLIERHGDEYRTARIGVRTVG